MSALAAHLTQVLLLLQSTVLLALGLLALHLTRKRGPAVQSLVGRASLTSVALLVLLLPLTGHFPPVVRVSFPAPILESRTEPTLPRSSPIRSNAAGIPSPEREGEAFSERHVEPLRDAPFDGPAQPDRLAQSAAPAGNAPAFPDPAPPAASTAHLPVYATHDCVSALVTGGFPSVSALLLLWLGFCQWHLTRLRRAAQAVTGPAAALLAGLTPNPPRLLTHPSVSSPFLAGYHRPVIFLPATFDTDFDASALRAIFVHELAHRNRCDNAWTLAARLLCAVLWPQPLLWLLVRRLEQISEDACDEAVLAADCPPRAYADCLLSLAARQQPGRRERALSAGVAPFRSSAGRRISHVLTAQGDRPMFPITLRLRLTAATFTVAAAFGGAFLVSSAPAQTTLPHETVTDSTARTNRTEEFQKQLKFAQDKLASAQTDLTTIKTQLTNEIHAVLPQANPAALAKAFDLEGAVGWSLSEAKLFRALKALSLKKHHLPSYEKEARYEAEALTRLKRCNLQEAELFPRTAETTRRLPRIHALSEHLYDQKIVVFQSQELVVDLQAPQKDAHVTKAVEDTSRKQLDGRLTREQQIADAKDPSDGQNRMQAQKGFLQLRDRNQTQLDADKKLLDQYEQGFQAELHQALPEAGTLILTKAADLEAGLGRLISSSQLIQQKVTHHVEKRKHYASPSLAKKYAQANQRHLAEIGERQAEIKPLLAEEARLFPMTAASQQLMYQVHVYAIKIYEAEIHTSVDTAQLRAIDYILKKHALERR